jgi:predicted esterase
MRDTLRLLAVIAVAVFSLAAQHHPFAEQDFSPVPGKDPGAPAGRVFPPPRGAHAALRRGPAVVQAVRGTKAGSPSATRADLAFAYLRFERAFLAATLTDADTVRVNRAFDALTLAFFTRDYSGAIRQLDALTASLQPPAAVPSGLKTRATASTQADLAAYRVRLTPAVYVLGSAAPAITIATVYEPAQPLPSTKTTLRLQPVAAQGFSPANATSTPAGSRGAIDVPLELTAAPGEPPVAKVSMASVMKRLKPGRYEIGFAEGGTFVLSGVWSVVSKRLSARASANAAVLAKLTPDSPAFVQAVASTTARNALLVDAPDPGNTAQMLVDPESLAAQVEAELAALKRGADPFKDRAGDYWRVLRAGTRDVPLRVYRPASVPAGRALPLVIALHGAGGDENMFMDAYGGGLIKRLADTHGFLVASPQTAAFGGAAGADTLDRLIEALGLDYAIDTGRIYVLGHSMGGMTAGALAGARPDRLAAVACLNGFSGFGADVMKVPPTFVSAGELDPVISPTRIEPAAKKAQAAGLPVEYVLLKNYGHTLAVTKLLPDVIVWLLTPR